MLTKHYLGAGLLGAILITSVGFWYVHTKNSSDALTHVALVTSTENATFLEPTTDKVSELTNPEPPESAAASTSLPAAREEEKDTQPAIRLPLKAASTAPHVTVTSESPLPRLAIFTKDTLKKYNGTNPELPIYIAFEGNVYDVTAGKVYYEAEGVYNFLAGTDGTELLRTIGGDIIKRKYPVIGTFNATE